MTSVRPDRMPGGLDAIPLIGEVLEDILLTLL